MSTTHNIPTHPNLSSNISFRQSTNQGVLHVLLSTDLTTEVHYWITTTAAIATFRANQESHGFDLLTFTPFTSKQALLSLQSGTPLYEKGVLLIQPSKQPLKAAAVSQHNESQDSSTKSSQQTESASSLKLPC